MQAHQDRADALLATQDDQTLLAFAERKVATGLSLRALACGFVGVRLRAPARIDLVTQAELPVILLRVTTTQRAWEVLPLRNTTLIAVHAETGEVQSGWAYPTQKRLNTERMERSREPSAQPEPEDAPSLMASAEALAARRVLLLPWEAGAYHLTVLYHDWASNTVTTRLARGEEAPAEAPLTAAQVAEVASSAAQTPQALAQAAAALGDPALAATARVSPSEDVSLTLSAPRTAGGTSLWISGEVALPLPAGGVVAGSGAAVAGVLRAALFLLQRDEMYPARIDLTLAVPGDRALPAGAPARARFALDLAAAPLRAMLQRDETLLYLVAGSAVAGPLRVAP